MYVLRYHKYIMVQVPAGCRQKFDRPGTIPSARSGNLHGSHVFITLQGQNM